MMTKQTAAEHFVPQGPRLTLSGTVVSGVTAGNGATVILPRTATCGLIHNKISGGAIGVKLEADSLASLDDADFVVYQDEFRPINIRCTKLAIFVADQNLIWSGAGKNAWITFYE